MKKTFEFYIQGRCVAESRVSCGLVDYCVRREAPRIWRVRRTYELNLFHWALELRTYTLQDFEPEFPKNLLRDR